MRLDIAQPTLYFFRKYPANMMERDCFASSLQTLESCFLSLGLQREVDALVACVIAIESGIKAGLNLPSKDKKSLSERITEVLNKPGFENIEAVKVKEIRDKRNTYAHAGFVPKDSAIAAALILEIGIPFLVCVYRELLGFDLFDSLAVEHSSLLRMALDVYQKNKSQNQFDNHVCFRIFAHSVRWHLKPTFMSEWEQQNLEHADQFGGKFDSIHKLKQKVENAFEPYWTMDCRICGGIQVLVAKLDEGVLNNLDVSFSRVLCVECRLSLPAGSNLLCDAFCGDEIQEDKDAILKSYGFSTSKE